jgi:hypothetical protein
VNIFKVEFFLLRRGVLGFVVASLKLVQGRAAKRRREANLQLKAKD